MGSGTPNELEVRMFVVLSIAFVLGGLMLGAFAIEFMQEDIDTWEPSVEGATPDDADVFALGMATAFIPGLGFNWLPVYITTFLTLLQIIWFYLLYAVIVRPLIPDWA